MVGKFKIGWLVAGILALSVSLAAADQHPIPYSSIKKLPPQQQQCRVCHKQVTPKIYKEWWHSKHGIANVRCFQCHGTFNDFHKIPPMTKCMACHMNEYQTMIKKAPHDKCWSCHIPHTFEFHGNGVKNIKTPKDFGINY